MGKSLLGVIITMFIFHYLHIFFSPILSCFAFLSILLYSFLLPLFSSSLINVQCPLSFILHFHPFFENFPLFPFKLKENKDTVEYE